MKCPVCDVVLKMTHRQSVEIDYCPKCRGIWLDRGELDKLIELSYGAEIAERPAALSDRKRKNDEPRYGEKSKRYETSEKSKRYDRYDDYDDDDDDDRRYRRRRRGSLLEDIFDIFD